MTPPLDLNLLTVFDMLYQQRSVTRTADRLGLTQSAISHALRRLRSAVGDPLFVRTGRVLQPTARAEAMAGAVREGLARLESALAPAGFDPATAQRAFTLAAGAYFCALLVPGLVAALRDAAPGVTLRVVPIDDGLLAAFDAGLVDLALGAFDRVPARLVAAPLFAEELVWIAAAGHPLAHGRHSHDALLAMPRVQIGPPRPFGMPDALRSQGGFAARAVADPTPRRSGDDAAVAGMVYDAATAIAIVVRTDLIALVPRRAALGAPVTRLAVAGDATTLDLAMLWPRAAQDDAGRHWLCAQVAAAV